MWDVVLTVLLSMCCFVAVVMTALRLPGTWLMVLATAGYAWWTDWMTIGPVLLGVLVAMAILGEIVEFGMSAIVARKAGASRRAAWGGIIGGFCGMIFLTSLFTVAVPVLGTLVGAVVGALVGCFGGAMVGELTAGKEFFQGTKVGFFSALGFALGTATKTAFALAMSGMVLTTVLWNSRESEVVSPPTVISDVSENHPQ